MIKKIVLSILGIGILGLFIGTTVFLYQKSKTPPVLYQTTSTFLADIVRKTVATGKIVPRKEIAVKSRVPGVVQAVYVEAGNRVQKDQALAKIELTPDMAFLSNAESEAEKARIQYADARREFERLKVLYRQKLISNVEFTQAEKQFNLTQEAVAAAENNVALIRDGASKNSDKVSNVVKATMAGILLNVPIKEGNFVIHSNAFNEGTTIATVANMDDMIFEGRVDESEVGKLKIGMPLELRVGALGETQFTAVLEYISPKGVEDQGAIKFEIRASVALQQDQFLRAGYSANADIVLEKRQQVLAINESNLIIEGQKTFVEVVIGEQQFERRAIKTGLSDGIQIEVVEGLTKDQSIKKLN